MKEFIRERKSNIDFSLHDSRIKKIFLEENALVFEIDAIYQYKEEVEHGYKQKFEILTESYCGGCTIYSGWLWKNHGPVSAN